MIYKEFFSSITVSRGFDKSGTHNTSLLTSCKQIHDEAKPYLAPNVFLHFKLTRHMLDDLTSYDKQHLESIRRLRVSAHPFPIYPSDDAPAFITFLFGFVLPMFPGLKLDLLVVDNVFLQEEFDDGFGAQGTYSDICCVIPFDGWKELHYISPSSIFMHRHFPERAAAQPQPETWLRELRERDQDATLEMYIAKESGVKGGAYDVETRSKLSITPKPISPDVAGAQLYSDTREVLLVAKRGKNASYAQDGSQLNEDLAEIWPRMTWPELKNSPLYVKDYDDDPNSLL